jgi:hypothetical protein
MSFVQIYNSRVEILSNVWKLHPKGAQLPDRKGFVR